VTRFKELRRIERAIENLDATGLEWSAQYCRLRLSFIRTKQGGALWRRLAKQVEDALKQIKSKSRHQTRQLRDPANRNALRARFA